ncbi:lipoprotein [Spiroplasma turonicum]|uniref:Uncharacterized protein n=1 Tax=Spiroplasma turonicum TaxID=216946 RepID=A0A0K1P7C9_9MOLU|nr:lipoprotein [Spiroplasma turonicum]AKU80211.1 hypothetical protein STURON_00965 [Spiroplasma turonicum]ALX71211.1 hypothetical protein STURO_v1c09600 [Spiroplasma turonicum]
MKKLLGILAATGLVATTGATVVSCGDKKADESSVKALGDIKGTDLTLAPSANDEAAAKTAAIAKIKSKLSVTVVEKTDVTFSDFKAAESAEKAGSIKVTAVESSKLVSGNVTFTLTFKAAEAKVDLSTVITEKALGAIDFKGEGIPLSDDILTAAVAKNNKLDKTQVEVDGITAEGANIKAKSDSTKYNVGTVAVTFTKQEAAKPTLSFNEGQESTLELTKSVSSKTITVKVANPASDQKITVKSGSADIVLGEVTGNDGAASYTFTVTASKNTTQGVVVTISYKNAEDLTLTVTASGFD